MTAIGVHVLGGYPNSASVISGTYGNSFATYMTAIDTYTNPELHRELAKRQDTSKTWLSWFDVPGTDATGPSTDPVKPSGPGEGSFDGPPGTEGLTEGFLDFLVKGLSVGTDIASGVLQTALPIALGPMAGPVGALAGLALNVAGKIAGSSTGTEADVGKSYSFDGVAERAILGEAALAAVSTMSSTNSPELAGVLSRMQDRWEPVGGGGSSAVTRVAPKILGTLKEPALRIALDTIRKAQQPQGEALLADTGIRRSGTSDLNTVGFGRSLDDKSEAFSSALSKTLTPKDAESFLDVLSTVGDVVSKGLRVAVPIMATIAQTTLSPLLAGTEADVTVAPPTFSFEGYAERAVMGEAALQSLMQVDTATLQKEGLFDVMKSVILKVGPTVLKQAPAVIDAVKPIVHSLLNKNGTESSLDPSAPSSNPPKFETSEGGVESAFLKRMRKSTEAMIGGGIAAAGSQGSGIGPKIFMKAGGSGILTTPGLMAWQAGGDTNLNDPKVLFVDCRNPGNQPQCFSILVDAANIHR